MVSSVTNADISLTEQFQTYVSTLNPLNKPILQIGLEVTDPMSIPDGSSKLNITNKRRILGAVGYMVAALVITAVYFYLVLESSTVLGRYLYYATHVYLWWHGYLAMLVIATTSIAIYTGSIGRPLGLCYGCGAGLGLNLGGIGIMGGPPSLFFRLGWALVLGGAIAVIVGGVSVTPALMISKFRGR